MMCGSEPAFPSPIDAEYETKCEHCGKSTRLLSNATGMSKRYWTAAQAMIGLISRGRGQFATNADLCTAAFSYADNLIEAEKEAQ